MKKFLLIMLIIAVAAAVYVFETSNKQAERSGDKAAPGVKTVLLDPGTAPRRLIRMNFIEGQKQSALLKQQMRMQVGPAGVQTPETKLPQITMPMEIIVWEVRKDGTAVLDAIYTRPTIEAEPEMNPMLLKSLEDGIQFLAGIRCQFTVTSLGMTTTAKCTYPKEVPAQMTQMMDQFNQGLQNAFVMLPEEEVGVGAKWKFHDADFVLGNLKMDNEASYELLSIDGDEFELSAKLKQVFPPQTLQLPQEVGQGMTAKLKSGSGEATGIIRLSPLTLVPLSEMNAFVAQITEVANPAAPDAPPMELETKVQLKMVVENK